MIGVYWFTLKDSFNASPILFILKTVSSILGAGSAIGLILSLQWLFESVEGSIGLDGDTRSVFIMLGVFVGMMIVNEIYDSLSNLLPNQHIPHVNRYTRMEFYKKASRVDPICYEDPKYLDEINKSDGARITSIWVTYRITYVIFYYIPYMILMGVYLYSLQPIMLIGLVFAALPELIALMVRMKATASLEDEVAPLERQYNAYTEYLTSKEFFKDTRLLGVFSIFKQKYVESVKLLNKKIWRTRSKTVHIQLIMSVLSILGFFGIIAMLFFSLMSGYISIGAFSAAFIALNLFFNQMERLLRDNVGTIVNHSGVIANYIKFMRLPEKQEIIEKSSEDSNIIDGITLSNVSFQYPNSEHFALKNINFKVRANEKIAIVGENGAGKSTLVKLLLGLYQPTEGNIVNNITKVSAVFQNYQRYKMTLKDNIEISDEDSDNMRINHSAVKAALPIDDKETLPQGIDTMLSREFDGVDLSGGQWQRVALARGLYRSHDVIVLDEPTAAIDPIEETELYKKFVSLAQNCIVFLVTHRLGSIRIADRIIVMHDGQIIEEGTHDRLLSLNNIYAKMFKAQSEWYER